VPAADKNQVTDLTRLRVRLGELADAALRGLPEMIDPTTGLFSHKTWLEGGRLVNREPNLLYSAVSLVGLLEQRRAPADDAVALGPALDALHREAAQSAAGVVLGNVVWASALAGDRRGEAAARRLAALDPARQASAELGQSLFGLVRAAEAYPAIKDPCERAARRLATELEERFSARAGVFRATPSAGRLRRRLVSGFTSFATQVYPLHGLAAFCLHTGVDAPPVVERVARRIVAAQGALGQWWWLYSTRTRAVLEGYPVYSVHQDGMAFLGLVPVERLGLGSYLEPLARGLDWVDGRNELDASLVATDAPLIWRCIQRVGSHADAAYGVSPGNHRGVVARSLRPGRHADRTGAAPERLEVLRECRSYHLGWLLYAQGLVDRLAAAP